MSSIVQRHLSNDERRIMDLALRRSVTIIEDPRDAEILRLRTKLAARDAQVAALLKVKEAAKDMFHARLSSDPTVEPDARNTFVAALLAYSEWEKTNAE